MPCWRSPSENATPDATRGTTIGGLRLSVGQERRCNVHVIMVSEISSTTVSRSFSERSSQPLIRSYFSIIPHTQQRHEYARLPLCVLILVLWKEIYETVRQKQQATTKKETLNHFFLVLKKTIFGSWKRKRTKWWGALQNRWWRFRDGVSASSLLQFQFQSTNHTR